VVECGGELWPIIALAAFDLDVFRDQRPVAAVQVVINGFALGCDAEPVLALLVGRNAQIATASACCLISGAHARACLELDWSVKVDQQADRSAFTRSRLHPSTPMNA
jgi:hypothetical protein